MVPIYDEAAPAIPGVSAPGGDRSIPTISTDQIGNPSMTDHPDNGQCQQCERPCPDGNDWCTACEDRDAEQIRQMRAELDGVRQPDPAGDDDRPLDSTDIPLTLIEVQKHLRYGIEDTNLLVDLLPADCPLMAAVDLVTALRHQRKAAALLASFAKAVT